MGFYLKVLKYKLIMLHLYYYHTINPIAFAIGPVIFHWYGIMYGIGFGFVTWFLLAHRRDYLSNKNFIWNDREIGYFLFLNVFGVLIGGRVGYVVFYQWEFFTKHWLWVFNIWEGGMSFHGGLIGVIIAIAWFSYKKNQRFFQIADYVIPAVPFGLGLGRIGNFINGELWGKVVVNAPIAVFFPGSRHQDILVFLYYPQWKYFFDYYGLLPRHPSQLYEMFLEGIVLFFIMNKFSHSLRPVGSISGLFLLLYGIFRIIVEFFRQPDSNIGFIYNIITMGQILSFPMIVTGILIIYFAYHR